MNASPSQSLGPLAAIAPTNVQTFNNPSMTDLKTGNIYYF
jgi:hypothetical protein